VDGDRAARLVGVVTTEMLRRKRVDGSPVFWLGCYGRVIRVARDGSWADVEWASSMWAFIAGGDTWRKRQPLDRLIDWQHG
jgi:hypothetical protein